ncbi:hypothetical protein EK904_003796, partial [Melospiza melodia maxima]
LFNIPKERKNAEYKRYLQVLLEYLQGYTDQVKPLLDQNELFGKIQMDGGMAHSQAGLRRPAVPSPMLVPTWTSQPSPAHLTHENVQRKQARTGEEREEEEEQVSDSENEDEENEIIYNPKNLPFGWDGKPIPYWLYKLHGLSINYSCEICGNCTYRGPRAFQRHSAEWRHAHGMRCLGIPSTTHFASITQIEDAVSLWAKLKQQKPSERWQPDTEEEYEDSSGNVVNKKTYKDLRCQGLL